LNLTVIGGGYVGCVSAACFARLMHTVLVVDTDTFKVGEIAAGRSPVREPGLEELMASQVAAGRLRATTPCERALAEADAILVCVSTPSLKAGGVDARPLQRVFASIGKAAATRPRPLTVVVRSTIAPGRLRQIVNGLPECGRRNIRLAANPEFLRETTAIHDFEHPPFILVGGDDPQAVRTAALLYAGINAPLHTLDLETALLVKYASNAYHALKIAFANEMATIAEAVGAEPSAVMSVFAEDRCLNVSAAYLRPGFAFGGSCLPKDVRSLVALGRELAEPLPLLRGVLESNHHRIERKADAIEASGARRLAMLGLSFKLGTDDLRESPYVLLAAELVQRGLDVVVYDPDIDATALIGLNRQFALEYLPALPKMLMPSIEAAVAGADGLILCKRVADPARLRQLAAARRHVFDLEYLL
jgi:GDP-mannose 6-dehydrogenase